MKLASSDDTLLAAGGCFPGEAAEEIPTPSRGICIKPRTVALLLGALAAAAKLYCAATTAGSVDIETFHKFARYVSHSGLAEGYRHLRAFNHPPVTAWIIKCTMRLARKSGEAGRFGLYFRCYSIIADFISLAAVLWLKEKTGRPAWWAIWLFAISPIHFAISGFHGNTDPILAMFIFLAAIACMGDRPIASGILYGLACNLKIAPVILFPTFFFLSRGRHGARNFSIAALVVMFAGWSPGILGAPSDFFRQVFAYAGLYGIWGVTCLARLSRWPAFHASGMLTKGAPMGAVQLEVILKIMIIAAAIFVPWRLRRTSGTGIFAVLTLVWAAFYAFAPGFGVQYLIWISAPLLLASERWFAFYTLVASIALCAVYTLISGLPWNGWEQDHTFQQWKFLGQYLLLLPWAVVTAYFSMFAWKVLKTVDTLPSTVEQYLISD